MELGINTDTLANGVCDTRVETIRSIDSQLICLTPCEGKHHTEKVNAEEGE